MLRVVMKSLRYRISCVAVVGATVVVVPLLTPTFVAADPIDDQRQRVEDITDHLEALGEQADILAEDYVVATDELEQLTEDVSAAEEDVAAQQAAVEELQGELSDVAVQAFMGAGGGGLGPIFTDSTSFNADLQRDELTRAALNTGTADSDDLDRELNVLAEAQELLENQRDAAAAKSEEVEEAKAATEAENTEYQQARTEAEAELGNLIQEEEERRARESYRQMQAEAEAAQQAANARAQQQQVEAQQQAQTAQPASGGNTSAGNGGSTSRTSASTPAAPATPNVPVASSRAGTVVNAAMTQLGVPWVFARSDPGVAFDCSGLTMWAWGTVGVGMPHQSRAQAASFPSVPSASAQPGDLVFYYSPISHVGIYIGGGQMVDAPNSGSVVRVATVNWSNVVQVVRPG